jgi:hypothetical protein
MKMESKGIRVFQVFACLIVLVVAAAAVFSVVRHNTSRSLKARADAIVFKKQLPEKPRAGENEEMAFGANENRGPDTTPDVQSYLLRAYPEAEVPGEATLAAHSGWAALNANSHSAGSWKLIGPSKATYPAALDPFLFDGAQYVASGRVTALALAPNCGKGTARSTWLRRVAAFGRPIKLSTVRTGNSSPAVSRATQSARC